MRLLKYKRGNIRDTIYYIYIYILDIITYNNRSKIYSFILAKTVSNKRKFYATLYISTS